MSLDNLTDEYQLKARREGFLHLGDATEALAATRDYQLREWLSDFILRWESVQAARLYPETSEAAVFAAALVDILGRPRNVSVDSIHTIARTALKRVLALQNGSASS